MRLRAVFALVAGLAALGLSAGGCSYGRALTGGSESGVEPAEQTHMALPPPQKILQGLRPAARAASRAELRWLGSYNRWWTGISTDLAFVADAGDQILAGETESAAIERRLKDVLDRLRRCETELSRATRLPKSERLRRLYGLLTDACSAIESVAASGLRILVEGDDPDLVTDWRAGWAHAESLLLRAYMRSSRLDPAFEQKLPVQGGLIVTSRIEPRFGRAASVLAGKRVRVRCWSREDWRKLVRRERLYSGGVVTAKHLGFAVVGAQDVNLSPEICTGLVLLAYAEARPAGGEQKVFVALSVGTLAHESIHSRGVNEESTTECFGMQATARTAVLLGVGRRYARGLGHVYWKRVYRHAARAYRTRDCRPGGPLDLRPNRTAWP